MPNASPAALTDAIRAVLIEHNVTSPNIDTDTLAGQIEIAVENVENPPAPAPDPTPTPDPGTGGDPVPVPVPPTDPNVQAQIDELNRRVTDLETAVAAWSKSDPAGTTEPAA